MLINFLDILQEYRVEFEILLITVYADATTDYDEICSLHLMVLLLLLRLISSDILFIGARLKARGLRV